MQSAQKLVITVTIDSTGTWPNNPHCPTLEDYDKDEYIDEVAQEYIESIKAGASIAHIHGVHEMEEEIQQDGRRLSKIDPDGWQRLHDRIASETDGIVQYGIASARLEQKIALMNQDPDMMSYAFNAHDEYFHPLWEDQYEPTEIYAVHPREELRRFLVATRENDVKPEVESFHTGAFFNMQMLREEGLLESPIWTTLFVGWPGGTWTPPTPKSLINFVEHLPDDVNWSLSCLDPYHAWDMLTLAIMLGGHVRVGWEDNPYLDQSDVTEDNMAESCADLVNKITAIANHLGREIATPDEAREITGLSR